MREMCSSPQGGRTNAPCLRKDLPRRQRTCRRCSEAAAHTGCCCVYSISSALEGMGEPAISSLQKVV